MRVCEVCWRGVGEGGGKWRGYDPMRLHIYDVWSFKRKGGYNGGSGYGVSFIERLFVIELM